MTDFKPPRPQRPPWYGQGDSWFSGMYNAPYYVPKLYTPNPSLQGLGGNQGGGIPGANDIGQQYDQSQQQQQQQQQQGGTTPQPTQQPTGNVEDKFIDQQNQQQASGMSSLADNWGVPIPEGMSDMYWGGQYGNTLYGKFKDPNNPNAWPIDMYYNPGLDVWKDGQRVKGGWSAVPQLQPWNWNWNSDTQQYTYNWAAHDPHPWGWRQPRPHEENYGMSTPQLLDKYRAPAIGQAWRDYQELTPKEQQQYRNQWRFAGNWKEKAESIANVINENNNQQGTTGSISAWLNSMQQWKGG